MVRVDFFVSNPNHHASMIAPVALALQSQGVDARVLSLCGLRGLASPRPVFARQATPVRSLLPRLPRRPGPPADESSARAARRSSQRWLWNFWLRPVIRLRTRPGTHLAVVPNDAAYPYDRLVPSLQARGIMVLLMQEGVRFTLPGESSTYGTTADLLAVWGEASAAHFRDAGIEPGRVRVTGHPRFDIAPPEVPALDPHAPLVLVTNPIDAQGFVTAAEKLELVARFVQALPEEFEHQPLWLRVHPGESAEAYFEAMPAALRRRVSRAPDEALESTLTRVSAAVVMASTAGLEAMRMGVPVAALPLPGHGYVFDYVEQGAAIGLTPERDLESQLARLRNPGAGTGDAVARYLDYHLAHRGSAGEAVASLIIEAVGR